MPTIPTIFLPSIPLTALLKAKRRPPGKKGGHGAPVRQPEVRLHADTFAPARPSTAATRAAELLRAMSDAQLATEKRSLGTQLTLARRAGDPDAREALTARLASVNQELAVRAQLGKTGYPDYALRVHQLGTGALTRELKALRSQIATLAGAVEKGAGKQALTFQLAARRLRAVEAELARRAELPAR